MYICTHCISIDITLNINCNIYILIHCVFQSLFICFFFLELNLDENEALYLVHYRLDLEFAMDK